jgi:hypothetical protein
MTLHRQRLLELGVADPVIDALSIMPDITVSAARRFFSRADVGAESNLRRIETSDSIAHLYSLSVSSRSQHIAQRRSSSPHRTHCRDYVTSSIPVDHHLGYDD